MTAVAVRPANDDAVTRPLPVVHTPAPVTGELIPDVSFALSGALASAQAALREARHQGIPPPLEVTATAAGVRAVAPLDDVLTWQRLLLQPRIAAADYRAGLVRITGRFDGQEWTLTSMRHGSVHT